MIGMPVWRTVRAVPEDGDYYGDDGLLRCGRCGDFRETRVDRWGIPRMPHDEPRFLILPCECRCRSKMVSSMTKDAEMEQRRRVLRSRCYDTPGHEEDEFSRDDGRSPVQAEAVREYLVGFEESSREGRGLLLSGKSGSGKSFLAACLANALTWQGKSVRYTSLSAVISAAAGKGWDYREAVDGLVRSDLVVLDDLGAERSTESAKEVAFAAVDGLYTAKVPIVVTTNRTVGDMAEGGRIEARILDRCQPILF